MPLETQFHPNVTANYTVTLAIRNSRVRIEGGIQADSSSCVDVPTLWLLHPRAKFHVVNVTSSHLDADRARKEEVMTLLGGYVFGKADTRGVFLYNRGSPTDFVAEGHEDWTTDCSEELRSHLAKKKLLVRD